MCEGEGENVQQRVHNGLPFTFLFFRFSTCSRFSPQRVTATMGRKMYNAIVLVSVCFLTLGSYWCFDTPGAIQHQVTVSVTRTEGNDSVDNSRTRSVESQTRCIRFHLVLPRSFCLLLISLTAGAVVRSELHQGRQRPTLLDLQLAQLHPRALWWIHR